MEESTESNSNKEDLEKREWRNVGNEGDIIVGEELIGIEKSDIVGKHNLYNYSPHKI